MDNAIAKMRAGRFIKNNGRVLRTINLLRYKYEKLEEVKYALEDMPENEYLDSLNYLSEAGYIQMRRVTSKQIAEIADVDFRGCNTSLCCPPITVQVRESVIFRGSCRRLHGCPSAAHRESWRRVFPHFRPGLPVHSTSI